MALRLHRYATGMSASADESVHPTIVKAAAWAWRLLVLFAAVLAVLFSVGASLYAWLRLRRARPVPA